MVQVTLENWELELAWSVGSLRALRNAGRNDAPQYQNNDRQDNVTGHVAGACCELAVAKQANRYWTAGVWPIQEHQLHKHLPDVMPNIEVRRVRERHNPVTVRRGDVESHRIIVAAYPHPNSFAVVDLIGWGNAAELWEIGKPSQYQNGGRFVDLCKLTPIEPKASSACLADK